MNTKISENYCLYHFICGYTSKLAEPEHSFSPAFGEAFLTLHPTMYSKTLIGKMKEHGAKAYLVNTGWNGIGKRVSLKNTRAIIDAIISSEINMVATTIPFLNLTILTKLNKVSEGIFDSRDTYSDSAI